MLERHQLFQIHGEHAEEDSIAEASEKTGQIECLDVETRIDEEIHHHGITYHRCHAYREQTGVFLIEHLAPEKAEEAAGDGSRPFHEVEHVGCDGTEMQHATRKGGLQHFRRTTHELYEGEENEQRDESLILPRRRLDVRVTDVKHSLDAEISGKDKEQYIHLHDLRIEPVVVLAIGEEEDELQHPCRPQNAAQIIDTDEGQGFHEAEVVGGDVHDDCHQKQGSRHRPVDDAPILIDINQVFGNPGREEHVSQHDAVEQGEEDGEIALGGHPQLDGTHTFEGSAELEEACDVSENAHQGYRVGPHDEEIAGCHYQCRIQQELAVGKVELHLEEEGEWHRHAHHVEHDDHEHVFSHQTVLAHHLTHGSSIDSARHQEDEGEEEINPWL